MTQFDFSHLYKTETVNILDLFTVTVREVPHGEYAKIQDRLLSQLDNSALKNASKNGGAIQQGMIESLKRGALSAADFTDNQTLASIQSWTLKDVHGNNVPVSIEVYRNLPHYITEKIEAAVEELNPALDAEFPSESDSEGTE